MEDNLNFLENRRRPQFEIKWKTTSISQHLSVHVDQVICIIGPKLEDNLNYFEMENDLKFQGNRRRPQFEIKWKQPQF